MVEPIPLNENKEEDKTLASDHGSTYHSLHNDVPGIYFIKTGNTEMVLKVVSTSLSESYNSSLNSVRSQLNRVLFE